MDVQQTEEWGAKPVSRPVASLAPRADREGAQHSPATATRRGRVYNRSGLARPASAGREFTAARPTSGGAVHRAAADAPVPIVPAGRLPSAVAPHAMSPASGGSRRSIGCLGIFLTILLAVSLALVAAGGGMIAYASIASSLPPPEELRARASQFNSTLIYDRVGGLLDEVADPNYGRRTAVPLEAISPHLINATIATEDPNFYEHFGVDPIGVARAIYYAVRDRDLGGPGGSTITQQLVKLTFLSPERSIARKVKEAILAAEITRRYSKRDILQIYLNEIYYGNLAYGIEAAAETYFDKRAADLTLAEAALLAGLPQAPAYYDPYTRLWNADGTPGAVKRRQGIVLGLMVKQGYITPAEAEAAWQEPLRLKPLRQTYTSRHPHFVQYVRSQIEEALGPELLAKGGLHIHTTLDPQLQAIAQEEVSKQVAALAAQGARNGAVVAVRPQTGEILAMVGSADFNNEQISGQINMALVPRQPGSAIKPFTYLATFEMPAAVADAPDAEKSAQISAIEPPGYWTPATAIMDIRTQFADGANPPYEPTNYDGREHGLVSVRSALANSYNIPAVKALEHAGLERLKDVASRVGITTLTRPDYGLSLTLGGGEVTLLELTGAYAVLANNGVRVPLSPIACVLNAEGMVIWHGHGAATVAACQTARGTAAHSVTPLPPQPVLNPQHVFLMTSILSDLEARRPMFGRSAELLSQPDRPAAAKTGTTNDYRDAWTLGYTPELAVGAWVGNADYTPMQKVAGGIGAAPIWHNVVRRSLQGTPPQPFIEPTGIQRVRVCADTGTLPSVACPAQREELFAAGQGPLPAQYDLYQRVKVDRLTGKLATQFTPPDRVEERALLIFPPRYRAWAEAHGIPQLALELPVYAFLPELSLVSPVEASHVQGIVPVLGRVRLPDPLLWQVEYGVGINPIGWGVLSPLRRGDAEGWLADWDTRETERRHGVSDFSLRLAAYDPTYADYPVAASNVVHLWVDNPTPTATPTATPTPTTTPTASPTPTATATPTTSPTATPSATWTPAASDTPPVEAPSATPASPTNTAPPETPTSPTPIETTSPAEAPTPPPTPSAEGEPSPTPATTTSGLLPAAATSAPQPPQGEPGESQIMPVMRGLITFPIAGQRLRGVVLITGSADGPGFAGYRLAYAAGDSPTENEWQTLAASGLTPVSAGILGVWQTQELTPGVYSLRLQVFDRDGGSVSTQVQVEIVATADN